MREHLVRLTKRGNSRGVCFPVSVLRSLGWEVDCYIQLLIVDEGLLLVRPKLSEPNGVTPGKQRRGRSE